jgi:hypothetical protein
MKNAASHIAASVVLTDDHVRSSVRMAGRHRCEGVWRNGFGYARQ